jgi:hypothetical protein
MRAVVESIVTHLEKHRQVPTMRIVSELVHSLVPDTESPAPLEPMSASHLERAWGDTHGAENATQRRQPRDTDQADSPPHVNREHTVPIRTAPSRRGDDDGDTLIANRPPIEALTVPVGGASALELSNEMAAAAPLPLQRARAAREGTLVAGRQKKRNGGSPARQVLLFVGSATLVLGVGIAAFVTVRAISSNDAEAVVPPEPPLPIERSPIAEPPAPRLLRVTSEPIGAGIFIDGDEASLVTPATLPIPPGRERVVIRAVLEGYVTQERPIHATAGEARFVLTALTTAPDAARDAATDADADGGEDPQPRMWRRRGMRRR